MPNKSSWNSISSQDEKCKPLHAKVFLQRSIAKYVEFLFRFVPLFIHDDIMSWNMATFQQCFICKRRIRPGHNDTHFPLRVGVQFFSKSPPCIDFCFHNNIFKKNILTTCHEFSEIRNYNFACVIEKIFFQVKLCHMH